MTTNAKFDAELLTSPARRGLGREVDGDRLAAAVGELRARGDAWEAIAEKLRAQFGTRLTADGLRKLYERRASKLERRTLFQDQKTSLRNWTIDRADGNKPQPNSDAFESSSKLAAARDAADSNLSEPPCIIIVGPGGGSEAEAIAMLLVAASASLRGTPLHKVDCDPVVRVLKDWAGADHELYDAHLSAASSRELVSWARDEGDVLLSLGPSSAGSAPIFAAVQSIVATAAHYGVTVVLVQALDSLQPGWRRASLDWLVRADKRAKKILFAEEEKVAELKSLSTDFDIDVVSLPKISSDSMTALRARKPIDFTDLIHKIEDQMHSDLLEFYNSAINVFESKEWSGSIGSIASKNVDKIDYIRNGMPSIINKYYQSNNIEPASELDKKLEDSLVNFFNAVRLMDDHKIAEKNSAFVDAAKKYYAHQSQSKEKGSDQKIEAPKSSIDQ